MAEQLNNIADIFSMEAPFAITMWDFSWVERRWPGAGYEDWDKILEELTERGYQAVCIDAFPHLMAADAEKEWTLKPVWNTQDWGSRSINKIRLYDAFRDFLQACRRHRVRVGLSTWFREDVDNIRMKIHSPQLLAEIEKVAEWSKRIGKPLITTECWAVVDYKDWPLLNWDWILELNAIGVKAAAATGRWAGMVTSNFCGPQFHGMWREKEWHQKMTDIIRQRRK